MGAVDRFLEISSDAKFAGWPLVGEYPRRTRGVALFVRNFEEAILILREFENKPHLGKYTGMYSIPMETSKPGEPDSMALERLVREELPGLENQIRINPCRVGWYRIVPRVWVSLYAAVMDSRNLPLKKTNEVGDHAWIESECIFTLWLRQGANEMINDGLSDAKGVVRRFCATPPSQPIVVF